MDRYTRETVEFQPVTVTVNGVPTTMPVVLSVVPDGARPDIWATATTLDGEIGVMVNGLSPGYWRVFAKVTANPEIPVIDCGTFVVT